MPLASLYLYKNPQTDIRAASRPSLLAPNSTRCARRRVQRIPVREEHGRKICFAPGRLPVSSVLSATFNFENLYSVEQVTGGFDALRQEMERIGHKAVGVHMERSMQQIVTK
jgi:hypothetical protein